MGRKMGRKIGVREGCWVFLMANLERGARHSSRNALSTLHDTVLRRLDGGPVR